LLKHLFSFQHAQIGIIVSHSIIDVHSHPLIPRFVEALGKEGASFGMASIDWSPERHIEVLDATGIGTGVLSLPGLGDALTGADGCAAARALNESLAELVDRYPDRFAGFATVPMDDMDAANDELAYALDVLKLDGIGISTHRHGVYLGEAVYDPWFEEMQRRGVTLFVHPTTPAGFDPDSRLNVSILEYMFDSTRMVTSMVLSGAKARFDKINIISTHGGGTIPYLANRIAMGAQMPWAFRDGVKQSVPELHAALGSFYYDLTAATSPAQLAAIQKLVPAEQLLLGTDFPLMPPQTIAPTFAAFEAFPGFSDGEKDKIRNGNARRLISKLS
jgi:6-methylsalicylate decarboxylase